MTESDARMYDLDFDEIPTLYDDERVFEMNHDQSRYHDIAFIVSYPDYDELDEVFERILSRKYSGYQYKGYTDVTDEYADNGTTFESLADAMDYVRASLGGRDDDYDIEAIASDVTGWLDGQLVLTADDEEYWAIVAKHDISF